MKWINYMHIFKYPIIIIDRTKNFLLGSHYLIFSLTVNIFD